MDIIRVEPGKLTWKHVLDIQEFMNAGFATEKHKRTFNPEGFYCFWSEALYDTDHYCMFLVMDGNDVVGILAGALAHDPLTYRIGAYEFHWRVSSRGKGYGMKLVEAFEEWARQQGATHVFLHGRTDKGDAQRVARKTKKAGYVISGFQCMKEI